jgi:hypothetical protein
MPALATKATAIARVRLIRVRPIARRSSTQQIGPYIIAKFGVPSKTLMACMRITRHTSLEIEVLTL